MIRLVLISNSVNICIYGLIFLKGIYEIRIIFNLKKKVNKIVTKLFEEYLKSVKCMSIYWEKFRKYSNKKDLKRKSDMKLNRSWSRSLIK